MKTQNECKYSKNALVNIHLNGNCIDRDIKCIYLARYIRFGDIDKAHGTSGRCIFLHKKRRTIDAWWQFKTSRACRCPCSALNILDLKWNFQVEKAPPGWLSGERVGLMAWWLWVRSPVKANFLSGVFSPLTSAEACGKSSRWLWIATTPESQQNLVVFFFPK